MLKVDPFSTGANIAAAVVKWGYKLIIVFSELDSPVAALVSVRVRVCMCACASLCVRMLVCVRVGRGLRGAGYLTFHSSRRLVHIAKLFCYVLWSAYRVLIFSCSLRLATD